MYQISSSGGTASGVTALVAFERGLDFNLLFADTLMEDEDLHRFHMDVARAVGKAPIVLTDGRTPWDVFIDKRFIGNSRIAPCSSELKTKQVAAWLRANAAPDDPLVLGMDWSEADRIERAVANWAPRPVISLLIKFKVYRWQHQAILQRHGIKPARLYDLGFLHNNCGGGCVRAGQEQWERLYRWNPGRYRWHESEEARAFKAIGPTARPFLKKIEKGVTRYLTLREFREFLDAGGQTDLFTEPGCGCFVDA